MEKVKFSYILGAIAYVWVWGFVSILIAGGVSKASGGSFGMFAFAYLVSFFGPICWMVNAYNERRAK